MSATEAGRAQPSGTGHEGPRVGSPVLLTAFNRVDTLVPVLDAIREARPSRLYLACDGADPGDRSNADAVRDVRRVMLESVDWDCEVETLFQRSNLGCGRAMSEAITWFFGHEEAGIILEDDCLPDPTFFTYCDELLERYADDERVMHISGTCLVDFEDAEASYFFSNYPQIWGWATWRDSWSRFSLTAPDLDRELADVISVFGQEDERRYWERLLRWYFDGNIDSWDYAWAYSIWRAGGVSTYPTSALVKNIGFGKDATHTKSWKDFRGIGERRLESIDAVVHPSSSEVSHGHDHRIFLESYAKPSPLARAGRMLKRLIR